MAKSEKIVQSSQAIVPQNEYIEAFKEGYNSGFKQGYANGYKQGQEEGFNRVAVQNRNPILHQANPNSNYQMMYPSGQQ